ncbi:DUF4468 domain-containing protein [Pedobacter sp. 22163]|uniref:DUF4468 domain-containing protein n=1 Tax=Pedobacter sp. 22163 TaxID=3453883 RepID=UPI003F851782
MKKILLIAILILTGKIVMAQDLNFPVDSLTQKATYSEVIQAKGSKNDLYNKAMEWLAINFKSSKNVVQLDDKDGGKIIAKFVAFDSNQGPVTATLTIMIKDERYKYILNDIYFNGNRSFPGWGLEENPSAFKANMFKYAINSIKKNSKQNIEGLITSLKKTMETSASTDF